MCKHEIRTMKRGDAKRREDSAEQSAIIKKSGSDAWGKPEQWGFNTPVLAEQSEHPPKYCRETQHLQWEEQEPNPHPATQSAGVSPPSCLHMPVRFYIPPFVSPSRARDCGSLLTCLYLFISSLLINLVLRVKKKKKNANHPRTR